MSQEPSMADSRGVQGFALPRHVAVIMDGNGRWATAQGLVRTEGHKKGLEALKATVKHAIVSGLETLTIFSFSSENWSRPKDEVDFLMQLLKRFVRKDLADLHKQNVRVKVIGRRDNLPKAILGFILEAEQKTAANTGLLLVIAFNYGAQDELARAAAKLAQDYASGKLEASELDKPQTLASYLDTASIPEPDLLIRTSGEQRISNFLLWQLAYTEFVFLECYWPEFDAKAFDQAMQIYASRKRRFGGLGQSA